MKENGMEFHLHFSVSLCNKPLVYAIGIVNCGLYGQSMKNQVFRNLRNIDRVCTDLFCCQIYFKINLWQYLITTPQKGGGVVFSLQFFSVYVCLSVCVSVNEQNSSRTDAPIWTWFSLIGLLIALARTQSKWVKLWLKVKVTVTH